MKNIQLIDSAENCTYSVYKVPNQLFKAIFPKPDQDIAFAEDLVEQIGDEKAGGLVMEATNSRVKKSDVEGIHGTLFIGFPEKRLLYPTRKESDLDTPNIGALLRRD